MNIDYEMLKNIESALTEQWKELNDIAYPYDETSAIGVQLKWANECLAKTISLLARIRVERSNEQ